VELSVTVALSLLIVSYPLYLAVKWVLIFFTYGKDSRPPEVNLSGKLHEPPSNLEPYFVDTLVNKFMLPTGRSISSTLLELVRKKIIRLSYKKGGTPSKRKYYFELDENKAKEIPDLPKIEQRLLAFIFQGSNEVATFSEIKTYGVRKAGITHRFWEYWKEEVPFRMVEKYLIDKESYFAKENLGRDLSILFTVTIASIYFAAESGYKIIFIFPAFTLLIAIALKIFNVFMYKKTDIGNEEYAKWIAFKRWLKDFSVTKNYPIDSLVLWEKYLVYGIALGVSIKALSELPINYDLVDLNDSVFGSIVISNSSIGENYDLGLFMSDLLEMAVFITGVYSGVEREEREILKDISEQKD